MEINVYSVKGKINDYREKTDRIRYPVLRHELKENIQKI